MNDEFYERVSLAIKSCGKSSRELQRETGISRQKIDKLRLRDAARLYADELPRICQALSVGFEELLSDNFPMTARANLLKDAGSNGKMDAVANQFVNAALTRVREVLGHSVKIDEVLQWYHSTGGRLAEYGQLAEYFAIFEQPKTPESALVALQVGDKCLARQSLNTRSPEEVTEYAASLDPAARFEITETYHIASTTNRWTGTSREVEVKFRTVSEPFILTYDITILPVTGADGSKVLLNFSQVSSVRPLRCITDRETRLGTPHSKLLSA